MPRPHLTVYSQIVDYVDPTNGRSHCHHIDSVFIRLPGGDPAWKGGICSNDNSSKSRSPNSFLW